MKDILHCDLNNFFASCEINENPSLKNLPVAVGGDEDERKGVVVAKNYIAKNRGIKTGMTVYQAKRSGYCDSPSSPGPVSDSISSGTGDCSATSFSASSVVRTLTSPSEYRTGVRFSPCAPGGHMRIGTGG